MNRLIKRLGEVSKKVPAVIISQPVFGGVNLEVYEVGRRLLDTDVISAHDMSKECAIVKFMRVLGKTKEVSKVRSLFPKSYEDEITSYAELREDWRGE